MGGGSVLGWGGSVLGGVGFGGGRGENGRGGGAALGGKGRKWDPKEESNGKQKGSKRGP